MPYEDDYKMWLEKMLIESNPDWVCDGMYDVGLTHEWCEKYCGEDSEYVTPKCLHMYYHHIARADRKTESSSEKTNTCDTCRFELYCPEMCEGCCEWDSHYEPKDEPQTERSE